MMCQLLSFIYHSTVVVTLSYADNCYNVGNLTKTYLKNNDDYTDLIKNLGLVD